MIGKLKEQIFQLSTIMQEFIKKRNENEEAPMHDAIETMNNMMLQRLEEMDKTLREISKEKRESVVNQINESNKSARKAKEKQKVVDEKE